MDLAKLLAAKRPEFDLSAELIVPWYVPLRGPLTIESALAMFDPFFFELRYPGELEELDGIGPDDVRVLDALVEVLAPFVGSITATAKPSPMRLHNPRRRGKWIQPKISTFDR